jgi:hypothetical protein
MLRRESVTACETQVALGNLPVWSRIPNPREAQFFVGGESS